MYTPAHHQSRLRRASSADDNCRRRSIGCCQLQSAPPVLRSTPVSGVSPGSICPVEVRSKPPGNKGRSNCRCCSHRPHTPFRSPTTHRWTWWGQPLRMHDGPRAFSAGASVCIVNSEQFSAVLTVNQRLLLRPRELFNCRFALHGLALRVEHFAVHQRHRAASACISHLFSACCALPAEPSDRSSSRSTAYHRTAEHIGISFHRISFPLIGWRMSRCAVSVQPRF